MGCTAAPCRHFTKLFAEFGCGGVESTDHIQPPRISPEALYATKRAINRVADAAGFRTAL
jgi:hypothetical protein